MNEQTDHDPSSLARDGDAEHMFAIGLRFEFGWGCEVDLQRAEHHYAEAGRRGHAASLYRLWLVRAGGQIRRAAPETAAWARKTVLRSARLGYGPAAYLAAELYALGYEVEKNDRKHTHWLRRGAELRYAPAMLMYAQNLVSGKPKASQKAKAKELFRQLAAKDNLDAIAGLGSLLIEGPGRAEIRNGLKLLHKAADRGHWSAHRQLGWIYARGECGVEQDKRRAEEHFEEANRLTQETIDQLSG